MITRDLNIQRTRLQSKLCQQFNLGAFFIKLPKGMDKHWEIVKLLVSSWEEIINKISTEKKPFAFEVPLRGKFKKY